MAVGLYGGTFNPVHFGHLIVAREAQSRCGLSRLVVVPAGTPPHKHPREMATSHHRLAMLAMALEDMPGLELSTYETDRRDVTYSIDTLRFFRHQLGSRMPLFFVMGLDAFLEIATWKEHEQLLEVTNLLITTRGGSPPMSFEADLPSPVSVLETITLETHELLGEDVRPYGSLVLMKIPDIEISASDIRKRLSIGLPIDHLCPRDVVRYITDNHLYQE